MDIGVSKEESKQTFRQANKILNLWIKKEMPFTYDHLLKKKWDEHLWDLEKKQQNLESYSHFKDPEEEKFFEKTVNQLGQLSFADKKSPKKSMNGAEYIFKCILSIEQNTKLTPEEKTNRYQALLKETQQWEKVFKNQVKSATCQIDKVIAGENSLIPYNMFSLYLYEDDKDDNDILIDLGNLELQQNVILKKIKNIIKNTAVDDLNELYKLDLLFLKIISLLNYSQFEPKQNLDFNSLEKWGKIGLWLIERSTQAPAQRWDQVAIKTFIQHIKKSTMPLVALIYANIAYFLAMSDRPEKIFSQNLLEIAQSLKEKITITPQSKKTIQLIDTISLCTQAKNGLNNKNIESFLFCLDKALEIEYRYTSNVFNMLYFAGKLFSETEPDKTQHYFQKALTLIDSANEKEKSLEKTCLSEVEKFLSEYKQKKLIALQSEIIKEFPNKCGVAVSGTRLNIFLHLESVPRTQIILSQGEAITELKKYDKVAMKDKIVTGFRFYTASDNNLVVIEAIRKLIQKIEKELVFESVRVSMQPEQKLPLLLEPVTSKPKLTPQFVPLPSRNEPKKKTRGHGRMAKNNIQPTIVSKPPLITKKPAEQYGFNLEGYSRVAPLFLSKESQAVNKPKIIVAWDDKKCTALDDETINKFKNLFHPNGVVQAREVNDSGFKVSIGPKKEWIVRGKLKGAGGSTRVYFKPIETKITAEGDEVTLCVLKKKMNK